jgi:hypothetical protein
MGAGLALALALLLAWATAASAGIVSSLDLSKPFATRTPWRLTATQGPEIEAIVLPKRRDGASVKPTAPQPAPALP